MQWCRWFIRSIQIITIHRIHLKSCYFIHRILLAIAIVKNNLKSLGAIDTDQDINDFYDSIDDEVYGEEVQLVQVKVNLSILSF